jgi:chromosome segregation ATPase
MTSLERKNLWDSIPEYKRRNPDSVKPPSERINPDIPGSHLWVVIVTNWDNMHPLMQDILYDWYRALSKHKGEDIDELDPKSTEALIKRFEELDAKLKAFDLERTNLEQELNIRDRDFQRLRSITGKKEKENIEVQQMLGKSFQEKIMQKQVELDEKEETIHELTDKINELENRLTDQSSQKTDSEPEAFNGVILPDNLSRDETIQQLKNHIEERTRLLRQVSEKLQELNAKITEQNSTITELKNELLRKDEKIKEIKSLFKS